MSSQMKRALVELKKSLAMLDTVSSSTRTSSAFERWRRDTIVAIRKTFGDTNHSKEFEEIRFQLEIRGPHTNAAAEESVYARGMTRARAIIESMIAEAETFAPATGAMARKSLSDTELSVLDAVIARSFEDGQALTGRSLRVQASDAKEIVRALDKLVPRYLVRSIGHLGDNYRPTFAGLLESHSRDEMASFIDGALAFLQNRLRSKPESAMFSWQDVQIGMGLEDSRFQFTDTALTVSRLAEGGSGSPGAPTFAWRIPNEIEAILKNDTCKEYVQFDAARLRKEQAAPRRSARVPERPIVVAPEQWHRVRAIRVGGQGDKFVVERGAGVGVMKTLERAKADVQDIARLQREADILGGLNHPCVVRLLDRGEDARHVWMVTAFAAHGSLQQNLAMFAGDVWRSLRLVRDVATALAYTHPKGIIHRDIKPGNLVLCSPDHVQLVDFGIAHDDDQPTLTRTAERVAPQWFGPPEARSGRVEPKATFDIYSLGKVLYVMLTGGDRFAGDEMPDDAMLSVRLKRPALISIDDVIKAMVRIRPQDRLQGMPEVVARIDQILEELFEKKASAVNACTRCSSGAYVKTGYLHGGAAAELMSRTNSDVTFTMFGGNVDVDVCNACGDMRLTVTERTTGKLRDLLRR